MKRKAKTGVQYTLKESESVIKEVERIPDGAKVLYLTEEELLGASFYSQLPNSSEMDLVFDMVRALHADAAEGNAFTSVLVPKIRYMSKAEKEEMLLAISDGMSYEDLFSMEELKAEDMLAFRMEKKAG